MRTLLGVVMLMLASVSGRRKSTFYWLKAEQELANAPQTVEWGVYLSHGKSHNVKGITLTFKQHQLGKVWRQLLMGF